MSFHSPFDEKQWQDAKRDYSQMRANLHALHDFYPPRTIEQSKLFHHYKTLIQSFGEEPSKPRGRIRATALNTLDKKIVSTFVDYLSAHGPVDEV